jgi:hypothetical protein
MKIAYRVIAALLLAGFMAACATTGEQQETAMQWMQNQDEMTTPGE